MANILIIQRVSRSEDYITNIASGPRSASQWVRAKTEGDLNVTIIWLSHPIKFSFRITGILVHQESRLNAVAGFRDSVKVMKLVKAAKFKEIKSPIVLLESAQNVLFNKKNSHHFIVCENKSARN